MKADRGAIQDEQPQGGAADEHAKGQQYGQDDLATDADSGGPGWRQDRNPVLMREQHDGRVPIHRLGQPAFKELNCDIGADAKIDQ